jgi:putative FmdB family regulatory protein
VVRHCLSLPEPSIDNFINSD